MSKRYTQIVSLLLYSGLALSGCDTDSDDFSSLPPLIPSGDGYESPVTETGEGFTITYQYNDGVIPIDGILSEYITRIESDSIIYFSGDIPEPYLLKPGSIISARPGDIAPYGMGNEVTDIQKIGNQYKCTTSVAPLDKVFKQLSWDTSSRISDELTEYETPDGKRHPLTYEFYDFDTDSVYSDLDQIPARSRGTVGSEKLATIKMDAGSKSCGVEGKIHLGAYFHCSGDIEQGTFWCYITPMISISGEANVGIAYKKELQDIDEYQLMKIPGVELGAIICGPLALRPYVAVETYLTFGASGQIKIKFGKTFDADIGYMQSTGPYITGGSRMNKDKQLIKNISLSGNISMGLKCQFDLGCGLYTKNQAIELNPYFTYNINADLPLFEQTEYSNGLSADQNIVYGLNVGAQGRIVINWFGKLKLSPSLNFLETTLYQDRIPLLGEILSESRKANIKYGDNPTANISYTARGGLLSAFNKDMALGLRIYQNGMIVNEFDDPQSGRLKHNGFTPVTINDITGLEPDKRYSAIPTLKVGDKTLNFGGWSFSLTEPSAEITDIVQTGSAFGIFMHNDKEYSYEYKFDIFSSVKGSDNFTSWGIYDPKSTRKYHFYDVRDGEFVLHWTAWSNNPSATYSKLPFGYTWDNQYKTFKEWIHTLYYTYDSSPNAATKAVPANNSDIEMQLESIEWRPFGQQSWTTLPIKE